MMDPSQVLEKKNVFPKPVGDCSVSKGNGRSWKSRKNSSHSLKPCDFQIIFLSLNTTLLFYVSLLLFQEKKILASYRRLYYRIIFWERHIEELFHFSNNSASQKRLHINPATRFLLRSVSQYHWLIFLFLHFEVCTLCTIRKTFLLWLQSFILCTASPSTSWLIVHPPALLLPGNTRWPPFKLPHWC